MKSESHAKENKPRIWKINHKTWCNACTIKLHVTAVTFQSCYKNH
jgi:hypothetical protein